MSVEFIEPVFCECSRSVSVCSEHILWLTPTLFSDGLAPGGVAGILFGLLILSEATFPGQELVFTTIVVTVLISIFLHGLTAVPAANAYGRVAESMKDETDMPEMKQVGEMPTKMG